MLIAHTSVLKFPIPPPHATRNQSPRHSNLMSRARVVRAALLSRLLVLLVSAAATNYAEPYDCSSTVSVAPLAAAPLAVAPHQRAYPEESGGADHTVHMLLSGFARWDAVYFLRLAHTSTYEFEQFHAFFPFFPACICGVAACMRGALSGLGAASTLSPESLVLVAGATVTHIAFVAAAVVLYELSAQVLDNERLALHASVLFCFSPASIFFSAIYTESPFALASFVSMLCFSRADTTGAPSFSSSSALRSWAWFLGGIAAASVATAIRSNGIVLAAFGLHVVARRTWIECGCRGNQSEPALCRASGSRLAIRTRVVATVRAVVVAVACTLIAIPFVRFQQYGHDLYCVAKYSGETLLLQERRPWCAEEGLSNLYAFVQSEYWNQGPFCYWTLKQIPNFLLAAPVLLLSVAMAVCYQAVRTKAADGVTMTHIFMLERLVGFDTNAKMIATSGYDGDGGDVGNGDDANQKVRRRSVPTTRSVFENRKTAAFVWHCSALAVLMFICFHVQVATRFLFAASPALYWYVADLVERRGENSWPAHLVLTYFCVYFILGATLFSAFYPWT